MLFRLSLVLIAFLAGPLWATDGAEPDTDALFREGSDVELEDFHWLKRPLVVFADSPNDPRFVQQMELLNAFPDELSKRDVVVITDTDPRARSALRKKLRPREFMLVLIGKDGNPYLRKPQPWTVREISRSIDKMPLRIQEERDRRELNPMDAR